MRFILINRKYPLFIIIMLFNSVSLFSLDLNVDFNLGNLGFTNERSESTIGVIWGTKVSLNHQISENFLLSGGIIIDEIYGNKIDSNIAFTSKYINIGIGPSLAAINNSQIQIKPALNGYFTVKKDGLIFFTSKIYSTFGNLSDRINDYSQLETTLEIGFYIPNALCRFTINSKQFSLFVHDSSSIVEKTSDIYSIYRLEADIHKKNMPFHLIISFGYRDLQRIFPINDTKEKAGIGSAFIGVKTKFTIRKKIELTFGIDSGLYNFSLSDEIAPSDLPVFLFNSFASFRYIF